MLHCPRCGGPVVLETDPPNSALDEVLGIVPEGRREADVEHLPDDVKDYYSQAVRALDADLPDAAAVALRRTLEAAASHFSHDERVLVKRIQGLIDDGLVTKQFGDVLHHVRRIGNIGAHASDVRIDDDQAKSVLSFTRQVLRNLFEIPAQLAALEGGGDEDQSNNS